MRVALVLFFACAALQAQINVLTANYGNERANANLQEAELTPSNVAPGGFEKIGSFAVDGQIYAQPLYVSHLLFPNRGVFNVVYTVTQHNSVYAYDADSGRAPNLLWHVNLGPSVPSTTFGADYTDIAPEIGILSTPVIDPQGGVIYVTAATLENGSVVYRLHALDLLSGQEKCNGPVVVQASTAGTGEGGSTGGQVPFDPQWHIQRPGLLLANGSVYVAFGSHGDAGPWHGWMVSYSASDLTNQSATFMVSPNGWGGSFWQSGFGLTADDMGNVYAISGNGSYDGQTEFSESILKFSSNLSLAGWATPPNWSMLANNDYDLSAGPALIPGTHEIVAGDKYGDLYLVYGDALAPLPGGNSGNAQIIQGVQWGGIFNFALWPAATGTFVYVQEQGSSIKAYRIAGGLSATAVSESAPTGSAIPFVGMSISANGSQSGTGILWETTGNRSTPTLPGTLHAFDAGDLTNELWNSDMSGGPDALGTFAKFANPTVVNGKVFVPTGSGSVAVYGLRKDSKPARAVSFRNSH